MQKHRVFKTVLFRKTGVSHLFSEIDCEDSVARAFDAKTGVTAVALSDGAGSYSHAGIGAEITARTAVDFAVRKFKLLASLDEATAATYILHEVVAALHTRAEADCANLIDYSATLLLACVHPDGQYLLFHVGDGALIGMNSQCEETLLSTYKHTGFSNEATFVTVPNTEYRIIRGCGDFCGFVLMSDGPEEYLVHGGEISPRIQLMQQMSFMLSESRMQQPIDEMVKMLTHRGLYDDVSFAILNDIGAFKQVLQIIDPGLRAALLGEEQHTGKRKSSRREVIVRILSDNPDGMSVSGLRRELRLHSDTVTLKKLRPLIDQGILERQSGRIRMVR